MAMTKTEQRLFCSPFQTMEIRKLMLQIRRTSHRNSFYGSGKMETVQYDHVFMCILTFTVYIILKHYQYNQYLICLWYFFSIYTSCCQCVSILPCVCPIRSLKSYIPASSSPLWTVSGREPSSSLEWSISRKYPNPFLLDRTCIFWCISTVTTYQHSTSLSLTSLFQAYGQMIECNRKK